MQVAVPRLVKFSGTVKDDAGQPKSGVVGITFALYKEQLAGAALWMETQNVQADGNGHYTVLLGAATAEGLPTDIFSSNDARWVGVQVQGQQQEQSRTLLVSTPYALKALDAETIGGKPASAFQLRTESTSAHDAAAHDSAAATEQANEITCASTTGCKANSIPLFNTNGGSATVSSSIVSQSGGNLNVAGGVTASANVVASNVSAKNQISGATGSFSGALVSSSTITGANLSTSGTVSGATGKFTGNVTAANLTTNGVGGGTVTTGIGQFGSIFGSLVNVNASSGTAIFGTSNAGEGVFGKANLDADFVSGVVGNASGATTKTIGVFGFTSSPNGAGVYGRGVNPSNVGLSFVPGGQAGVWGDTNVPDNSGVLATADDGSGVFALNNSPFQAAVFAENISAATGADTLVTLGSRLCLIDTAANLSCGGTITGSSKNFKIDHPGDPTNKYLVHASVESSELMNIYTGNVTTDANGEATVSLPAWFEVINTDFRYQLTVVGQFAQAIVGHKIENHQFQIKTNTPNVEVSWQVTGVRQDPYAKAHPLVVEQDKGDRERGFYIDPTLYGAPAEKQLAYGLFPEQLKHRKGTQAKP